MAKSVKDAMTKDPCTIEADRPVAEQHRRDDLSFQPEPLRLGTAHAQVVVIGTRSPHL